MADDELIGLRGSVTVSISESRPGEVQLKVGQTTSTYIAYADAPVERGRRVVVIDDTRGGRSVDVEPI